MTTAPTAMPLNLARFDRRAEFVVFRPFKWNGRELNAGEPFPKSTASDRRLRQLYESRKIAPVQGHVARAYRGGHFVTIAPATAPAAPAAPQQPRDALADWQPPFDPDPYGERAGRGVNDLAAGAAGPNAAADDARVKELDDGWYIVSGDDNPLSGPYKNRAAARRARDKGAHLEAA